MRTCTVKPAAKYRHKGWLRGTLQSTVICASRCVQVNCTNEVPLTRVQFMKVCTKSKTDRHILVASGNGLTGWNNCVSYFTRRRMTFGQTQTTLPPLKAQCQRWAVHHSIHAQKIKQIRCSSRTGLWSCVHHHLSLVNTADALMTKNITVPVQCWHNIDTSVLNNILYLYHCGGQQKASQRWAWITAQLDTCHWIQSFTAEYQHHNKTRNVGQCPTWWPPCRI